MKIHTALGPGLLESAYESCLAFELCRNRISHQTPVKLPIEYEGHTIDSAYRLDLLFPGLLIMECKAVESILPVHKQQITSYLKRSKITVGLLINFNVSRLKDGITRIVDNYQRTLCEPLLLRNLCD